MNSRLDLLQHIAQTRGAESYLEIGCAYCRNVFNHIDVARKVGVDPEARGGGELYKMTSDEWFQRNGGEEHFDLIFVDGFHEAAQALRDVNHALEVLAPGGAIVLHDCNPSAEWLQRAPRPVWRLETGEAYERPWTGDVWKAFVQLRCRPDLDCACWNQDYGCGVVLRRENGAPYDRDEIATRPGWISYADLEARRQEYLRLMDWGELVEWIG